MPEHRFRLILYELRNRRCRLVSKSQRSSRRRIQLLGHNKLLRTILVWQVTRLHTEISYSTGLCLLHQRYGILIHGWVFAVDDAQFGQMLGF